MIEVAFTPVSISFLFLFIIFVDMMMEWDYHKNMVINQTVKYDSLSMIFAALADPTRRSIVSRLSEKDVTVNELAKPYNMSLPAISKHLKVLEQAGLVSTSKEAQRRPRHLETTSLKEATEWLEDYRQFWEHNLDSLGDYLQEIQSNNKKKEQ